MAVRTQVNGCRTKNSTTWGNNGDIVYAGATRPGELRTEYFTPFLSGAAGTANVVITEQGGLGYR